MTMFFTRHTGCAAGTPYALPRCSRHAALKPSVPRIGPPLLLTCSYTCLKGDLCGSVGTEMRLLEVYAMKDERTCGYAKWIDKPWQGRERSVIANLASKKEVLEKKLKEKDGDIEAVKEKQRMEKRMIAMEISCYPEIG
ncbi:hypothetical protein TRIUR3_24078 [Triticum urartu]|uniref:Uncharacterized protein n=1 Tax=Triticum urartu TaxID=4572 RepID=M7ZSE9_TRIUA|nr:hypothetical protein TRIUR3_24078 [Triticum urartu]